MIIRFKKVIGIVAVILLASFAYAFFCKKTGLAIPCAFHSITGLKCPGCGVTRMCLSLMNFDFLSAFNYNQALFCLIPVLMAIFIHIVYRYVRYNTLMPNKFFNAIIYAVIVIMVAFAFLRNIFGF